MNSAYTYFFDELQKIAYYSQSYGGEKPKDKSLAASPVVKGAVAGSMLYGGYHLGKNLAKSRVARAAAGICAAGLGLKYVKDSVKEDLDKKRVAGF